MASRFVKLSGDLYVADSVSGVRCYKIKKKFSDGFVLAYYSDTPRGCTEDQERGWVVIDSKKNEVIDEQMSFCDGYSIGETREWLAQTKKEHS